MTQEALKLALEALEDMAEFSPSRLERQITAIKEALAQPEQETPKGWKSEIWKSVKQPEQEPVLWMMPDGKTVDKWGLQFYSSDVGTPLYTTPPQRKPLTDEQILSIARDHYNPHQRPEISFARAIEAAHGIKGDDTTPPQRTWVGLTDEEVDKCYYWKDRQWTTDELVRHVEAKLKQKNGFAEEKNA